MRTLIQRVRRASVDVEGERVAEIGRGLLVFAGFGREDGEETLSWMARKIVGLRVFEDESGKMNRSVGEVDGEILVVSQFTLYGDCLKGRRPSFDRSARVERGRELYEMFLEVLRRESPVPVRSGVFRAHMAVDLVNDGPVTLWIEKEGGEVPWKR
jgi:D-tyrosyl-tRNA(Tyr) deacylase